MPNRLHLESSPYLRQHAGNPVDWYAWGPEALDRASSEDKPILLSIGYSSCHWCHVMAHESFEDSATAAVMNENFVNIKVDREERPDLDKIYQLAHQILTQTTGGWPLTIFLDPQTRMPFFSGTYFPKSARYQLPAFTDLLNRVHDAFVNRREDLSTQAEKLTSIFNDITPKAPADGKVPGVDVLKKARDSLAQSYDSREGGFGDAPKFPMPATLERLLRHFAYRNRAGDRDREALDMTITTLTKMARGGIYDHLGGGFCRYATDRNWMIPHFEKMLYDNGPLLSVYADAIAISSDALFEGAVRETASWVMREMQHVDGGYFSSLDADSEGHEGKYYVWRRNEIKQLLTEDEHLVIETLYGIDKPANFEGKWNLHRYDAWRAVIEQLSLEKDVADALLLSAKQKLFAAREQRVRPGRDDKVLASWNGMMIKGMAKAAMRLNEPVWLDSAFRAADFLRENLLREGRLMATWADGRARHPAYLDDYANLLDALLTLLQARWRDADLRFAIALADAAIANFEDTDQGGFFFTAHDHETLIHRPKPSMDDALPCGNAVLARALLLLGNLMSNQKYIDAAERTLVWSADHVRHAPAGHCAMLSALEDHHFPPELILINGPSELIGEWLTLSRDGYKPWRHSFAIPNDGRAIPAQAGPPLAPPYLPHMMSAEDRARPIAYVCSGLSCSLPIKNVDALKKVLAAR